MFSKIESLPRFSIFSLAGSISFNKSLVSCKESLLGNKVCKTGTVVTVDGLISWLEKRQTPHSDGTLGDAIDARLYSYALGLQALPQSLLK